jgi:hypothetical protein
MLIEDASNFFDGLGRDLSRMAGAHREFGFDPFDMTALKFDHTVISLPRRNAEQLVYHFHLSRETRGGAMHEHHGDQASHVRERTPDRLLQTAIYAHHIGVCQ